MAILLGFAPVFSIFTLIPYLLSHFSITYKTNTPPISSPHPPPPPEAYQHFCLNTHLGGERRCDDRIVIIRVVIIAANALEGVPSTDFH